MTKDVLLHKCSPQDYQRQVWSKSDKRYGKKRCRCAYKVTAEMAEDLHDIGVIVYEATDFEIHDGRVVPVEFNKKVGYFTGRLKQTPRIDMFAKADIERAFIDNMDRFVNLLEQCHDIIIEARQQLIVPFQPDPFEGFPALRVIAKDERSSMGVLVPKIPIDNSSESLVV